MCVEKSRDRRTRLNATWINCEPVHRCHPATDIKLFIAKIRGSCSLINIILLGCNRRVPRIIDYCFQADNSSYFDSNYHRFSTISPDRLTSNTIATARARRYILISRDTIETVKNWNKIRVTKSEYLSALIQPHCTSHVLASTDKRRGCL